MTPKRAETPRLPSKYGNKPTEVDGIRFSSKREARRWQDLCLLEKAGQISKLERQVRFPIVIGKLKVTTYVADFTYLESGMLVVEDAKGMKTREYVLKKKLMQAVHGIIIRES
jgi:hypothetical protein